MVPRLASALVVSALLRVTGDQGGFGTVIARGDAEAGAILIVLAERGVGKQVFERILQPDGRYGWLGSIAAAPNESEIRKFLEKRRRIDPDCWVVELDIAPAERFTALIAAFD